MSPVLVYIDRGFLYFDCTLEGVSCIVLYCALVWASFVLIVLWQRHPLLYCALVWSSLVLIVLWQGHPRLYCALMWTSLVLIVLRQGHPLLYGALVWTSLVLIYFGRGILYCIVHWFGYPLFWLYFDRGTFCLTWISLHTLKNPFFLHLRGSQLFAAELLRSQWSP